MEQAVERPQQPLPATLRLAYLVSHPIQYQAPLLRRIAREPDLDLTVLFGSDVSVRAYRDEGFGVDVAWDVPLLEGYRSEFLAAWRDNGSISASSPISRGVYRRLRVGNFAALWVHGYASLNGLQGMLAARSLGIPVLLRAESWLADRERSELTLAAKQAFFTLLRGCVTAVLPIGSANAAYWRHYLPGVPQFPVPYAVDNQFFAERTQGAAAREHELRAELGLAMGRPVVLFASKLQPRKHADHLIAAYRALLQGPLLQRWSGGEPPALVIVGDGEERARLQAMAADLEGVRFTGFRNQGELPRFFQMATVFVLPSRHEPWGLIVNEAMAAGVPVVVSSDVGSAADLVREGVEGCVFPVGDVAALTAALQRVLGAPGTARSMGEAAQARMRTWSFEQDVEGLRAALTAVARR